MKKHKDFKTVLVAMPYSRDLTQELLIGLFDAFKDSTEERVRFILKFHPVTPSEGLVIQLPAHFHVTDEPISELLKEADLVIYSSSSVGLEALLGCVPVVRYRSAHIVDLDPLDAFDEGIVKSCSEKDMKRIVLSALKEGGNYLAQQSALGTGSLKKFFSPVDEDAWRQIVRLEVWDDKHGKT